MNAPDDAALAVPIEAARRGELVVFAGAGISMAAPSCVPDWYGFNAALLEEIKAAALALPGLDGAAAAAIRRLDVGPLGVESFSDVVVRSLAGESYFPLLEVLDADRPNAHHAAIAELARSGGCRAVVTTNFDTLLETAFQEAGVDFKVFEMPEAFHADARSACPIYKIHGSVTAASSLVDTVSQKLRGLPFPVRARLVDLYHRCHVLVVGCSGEDLKFGADYFALAALGDGDRGITWVVQPGRELHPRAAAFVDGAAGAAVHATLADLFTRLGIAVTAPTPPGDAARTDADRRARERIRAWLHDLGGGALPCVNLCVALADQLGRRADAHALRAALAADIEQRGAELPLTAIASINGLAIGAEMAGDIDASERWARRALALHAEVERSRQALPEPVGPAGLRDMASQAICAWTQLGRARAARGDGDTARRAYAHASRIAAEADDALARASLQLAEAQLLGREGGPVEPQIDLARRAWSIGTHGGDASTMAHAVLLEGHALASIGEYDAALAALERSERVRHWSGGLLARQGPDLLRAAIAARRGDVAAAVAAFDRTIGDAQDPVLEARLRLVAVSELIDHPSAHAHALSEVDAVLAAMADGRVPRDGSNALLASEGEARAIRAEVVRTAAAPEPWRPTVPPGVAEGERDIRATLMAAEHANDPATASAALHALANRRYDAARPRRMLDLAEAAALAARRSLIAAHRHRALHLNAVARDLSGDYLGAIAASRALLAERPPADAVLRSAVSQSLAHVLAKVGQQAEALRLLREVLATRERGGNAVEHARTIITLADTLLGGGDATGARAALRDGAGVIERSGDRGAMTKRDEMLAALNAQTRTGRRAAPLLFVDERVRATAEEVAELRRKTDAPRERCDIAALALASGQHDSAVELVLQAQAGFHRDHDTQGIVRCFHLLADAAQADTRWDAALDFTRHALTLEQDLEDAAGQVASYAALAFQSVVVARHEQAVWAATECLRRAAAAPQARFVVIAHCARAEAMWYSRPRAAARRAVADARAYLRTAADLPPRLRAWLAQRLDDLGWRGALRRAFGAAQARLRRHVLS